MARSWRSVTTFTTLGFAISSGSSMRFFSVPMGTSVSSRIDSTAASIAAGSISGSSPWILTISSAVLGRGDFRDTVGTGGVVVARHSYRRAKRSRQHPRSGRHR